MGIIYDFGDTLIFDDKITHVTFSSGPYGLIFFIEGREEGIEIQFHSKEETEVAFAHFKTLHNVKHLL